MSRLQKVNFSVRGQANSDSERCDGCNYLKLLPVRLSPQAVFSGLRLFAGDSVMGLLINFLLPRNKVTNNCHLCQ
jgi:hypothetical protein